MTGVKLTPSRDCSMLYPLAVLGGTDGSDQNKLIDEFDSGVADRLGIDLSVLKPREFDLVVSHKKEWSATYDGRPMLKPDAILCRTGAETNYFTLAVLRHFERQGVMLFNGSPAVEAVADKLQTLQILAQRGIPIPKTILGKFPAVGEDLPVRVHRLVQNHHHVWHLEDLERVADQVRSGHAADNAVGGGVILAVVGAALLVERFGLVQNGMVLGNNTDHPRACLSDRLAVGSLS